jgi:proline dehydrogenase
MKLPFFLARRFVAAETLDGALPVLRALREDGLHTTVDLLGEYISKRALAVEARDAYISLLRTLADEHRQHGVDANISVKLSMMGQKIDEEFCLDNLRQLLDAAVHNNAFIRLDMEGSDITESTLRLFEAVYPDYRDHVGIVLQAYLKRTRGDIERMCDLNARVRLCKGAYKEPPDRAHQSMDVIRERFIEYMHLLLKGARYPAIATHDDQLLNATRQFVRDEGIPHGAFEFQMLYGLRPQTQQQIARDGYNMRVYVPYGKQWLPYYSRRLRERKENIFFILKHMFRK